MPKINIPFIIYSGTKEETNKAKSINNAKKLLRERKSKGIILNGKSNQGAI